MGMVATREWTVAEVLALPYDGRRYELIDGGLYISGTLVTGDEIPGPSELVTPSPSWVHQRAVLGLAKRLDVYLRERRSGTVLIAPADVELAEGSVVEPDVFVVPLVAGRAPRTWQEAGRLLLAVEVLSPGTARVDRVTKRRLYQRHGVPEYWIVHVDARIVERWRPGDDRPEMLEERLEWRPDTTSQGRDDPSTPALVIELGPFFAEIADG